MINQFNITTTVPDLYVIFELRPYLSGMCPIEDVLEAFDFVQHTAQNILHVLNVVSRIPDCL
jgi:hypothetical protein